MAQHCKRKREKNNLGTSSIFHEFSFRPKPPVTVVDRSSCCHIFNTWGYSCSPWGLPLTPAASEAAPASAGSLPLLPLLTCGLGSPGWNPSYSHHCKCVSWYSHWKTPPHSFDCFNWCIVKKMCFYFETSGIWIWEQFGERSNYCKSTSLSQFSQENLSINIYLIMPTLVQFPLRNSNGQNQKKNVLLFWIQFLVQVLRLEHLFLMI